MWLPVSAWNFKFREHKFGFLLSFPFFFHFILRMFVWPWKLQSFSVFNLGNAGKFWASRERGKTSNVNEIFESGKYGIGGSVEGPFVFWVRLIRNIFDMQSRLKSVWHIMWSDPISGPISDQRKLDQNQTNTIQFQCIISGYFGPLNSHKRELNLFRQPQKFRFNFKQISRPHQRGHQCWKRGPHTKASPNCGSSRQRFRAEWFQLTKKTNSPDNLPNAFRQKRNSRRRRKKIKGQRKLCKRKSLKTATSFAEFSMTTTPTRQNQSTIELWERVKVEQVNKNYALFDCQ